MTARQVFEGTLTELSKVKAPSLTLDEFNYYFNKAINQYINKRYNIYDVNQQTTDDVRVLKSTAQLVPTKTTTYKGYHADTNLGIFSDQVIESLYGATYEVNFPTDYLHILNCICIFKVKEQFKCYDAGSYVQFGATRLTSDSWSTVINDFYNRPLPWRPYFYIHNVNTSNTLATNPYIPDETGETLGTGTDWENTKKVIIDNSEFLVDEKGNVIYSDTSDTEIASEASEGIKELEFPVNLARELKITKSKTGSLVEKTGGVRYGNASTVRCEIRFGKDDSIFELVGVVIDYLKAPQHIRLTQEQIDLTKDTSQMMEFPDYVCQEIINELTHLVMERDADPRLQSNIPISTSIAQPAQQQAAPAAQQQ